jgi:hypothetical protein
VINDAIERRTRRGLRSGQGCDLSDRQRLGVPGRLSHFRDDLALCLNN